MTVPTERQKPLFQERVWPAPWVFLATGLVLPASVLVLLPINLAVGIGTGVVLYAGCVVLLLVGSPSIAVTDAGLAAGRATLPARHIGEAGAYRREDATRERGPTLDARAWLLIRGWVDPVVRVDVVDERDPVPYWLLSTRRPEELVSALDRVRQRTPDR